MDERWVIALYVNSEFVRLWRGMREGYYSEDTARYLVRNLHRPTPDHEFRAGTVSEYAAEVTAWEITNE